MRTDATPLFNRPDTMLGICEGIGRDFGFNANYLRIALAVGLLWRPEYMVAIYLGLGVVVLLANIISPDRAAVPSEPIAEPTGAIAANDMDVAQSAEPERIAVNA